VVIRKTLTASFISKPLGTGPHTTVFAHIGCSSGRISSTASASPASLATSAPASAGPRDPDTGAST
jgi:hypothetical protein